MGNILDKSSVLDRIKQHYSLKGNADLARFLGVAPNTITNWYSRSSFDLDMIYTKCVDIDFNWLLTGDEPIHHCDQKQVESQTSEQTAQSDSSSEAAFYCKLYKEKDAEVGLLKEEIGALKQRINQLEAGNIGGKKTAKNAPIKKPSSPNADNVTSVTAP